MPKEEYLIVNSAWLSLMNIRINGDLDILISTKLWDKKFKKYNKQINFGLTKNFDKWIRVHSIINGPYVRFLKLSNDDLIYNYRCEINGIPFIFPRLYFRYKLARLDYFNKQIKKLNFLKS